VVFVCWVERDTSVAESPAEKSNQSENVILIAPHSVFALLLSFVCVLLIFCCFANMKPSDILL